MTRVMRATWALYMGHLITFTRSRTAAYWTLGFPLFFLLIFGVAFGRGQGDFNLLMPGLLTITVISGSLFGVSLRMVTERETGILRRHRLTPVHAISVVLAHGAMAFTTLAASLLVQAIVARLVFGFRIAGSIGALMMVIVLGGMALIPFGLIVGSVARDSKVAPAMTNFLFFPLMFLSGAAIPFPYLPEWLQRVARLVPTTYLVEALQGVIVRGVGALELGAPVIMLLLTAVIGVSVNGLLFRWESNEPVRYRRLLLAVVALGLIYGAAFAVEPTLHIARKFGP
jgi:ABC-2 type transport system permease protein